ncbi:TPA: DUF6573 family protein [Burkholderia cepacia]
MNRNTTERSTLHFDGRHAVSKYKRAQALEDGVLVEVPLEIAELSAFKWPIALTAGAWAACVDWPADDKTDNEPDRVFEVLKDAWMAVRRMDRASASAHFSTTRRIPRQALPSDVPLTVYVGPGDDGEPVITIALRSEES